MDQILHAMEDTMGRTPLVELHRLENAMGLRARILAKLEGCNPTGSAKDRAVLAMLLDAEERGLLQPGGTLIEPTSGNTGISLAALGAARGYRVILVMPAHMSRERMQLMRSYGAQVVLTEAALGMAGAIRRAEELTDTCPGSLILGQFTNPANPAGHYRTTGPEIWAQTGGKIDWLIAGVGTGGTLSGTAQYLKEKNPDIRIAAVEPASSPVLSGGAAGPHAIEGIGAGFVPQLLQRALCDRVIPVSDQQSMDMSRGLARLEGILAGVSSGAALAAAVQLARQPEQAGKLLVAVLPDSGQRYLSTTLFEEAPDV